MRVRFAPEALTAVREKRAWWVAHREKAPRLFVEELTAVVTKLRVGADQDCQHYVTERGRLIWRLAMPRTRNHVYYRHDAAGDIVILTVWNATAGSPPDF
ncbi:MAG TPA: hypothetical protein VHE35_13200 [Kofleriaceae bacterium]|nr:hypothetical protein [Kofleriaceae bacterium]